MPEQENQMTEEQILYNGAKTLLELGKQLKPINDDVASMSFFLSERVLNIADQKGLTGEKECNCNCAVKDVQSLQETPTQSTTSINEEVNDLVEKIRSESKNAQQG